MVGVSKKERFAFKIGDKVLKSRGYCFPGEVIMRGHSLAGKARYVVEATHPVFAGMLHIFNADVLEKTPPKSGERSPMAARKNTAVADRRVSTNRPARK